MRAPYENRGCRNPDLTRPAVALSHTGCADRMLMKDANVGSASQLSSYEKSPYSIDPRLTYHWSNETAPKGGLCVMGVSKACRIWLAAALCVAWAPNLSAQTITTQQLDSAQLFALADAARDRGDYPTAETAYRALMSDPNLDLRLEARFRLALMLADLEHRPREAAVELRHILDEKPGATRVRLELARLYTQMGDLRSARRELRAVQTSKLPPDVERMVRFYANALVARKRTGASIEVSFAPDTNINRATRSDTLGTVLGDFTLNNDARAQSGLGGMVRAQAYTRFGLTRHARMLLRVSGNGSFYGRSEFNDAALSVQAGPEIVSGTDRLSIAAGPTLRWYGQSLYSLSCAASGDYLHPVGKRGQLLVSGAVSQVDNRRNDLQDGTALSLTFGVDRSFSTRFGGGISVTGARTLAHDPGYSDATAVISAYLYREAGRTSLVAGASYSHLEADERLFLYPERRRDDRFSASVSATLRALTFHTFSPFVRVTAERNRSTVGIYRYSRVAGQFGLTSAF